MQSRSDVAVGAATSNSAVAEHTSSGWHSRSVACVGDTASNSSTSHTLTRAKRKKRTMKNDGGTESVSE